MNSGSWILEFWFWTLDLGFWILELGFGGLDLELFLFWISDFQIWNLGFWTVVRGAALQKGGVDLPTGERVAITTVTTYFGCLWILDS